MSPAAAAFWRAYLATLTADHPHHRAQPEVFAFGGGAPALADALAALVVAGRKRATTSLEVEFSAEGSPLPGAGDVAICTRADGRPAAVIEFVEVRQLPFRAVDAAFAAEEGEGDGSLESWRASHRKYFGSVCARLGGRFDDETRVLCQRFRLRFRE